MTDSDLGFHLNLAGGAEVLKVMAAKRIAEIAQTVAAQAGSDAEVKQKVTDRSRATVKVPADQQAKDGVLSRAAASAGLDIVQRTPRPRRPRRARAAKRARK